MNDAREYPSSIQCVVSYAAGPGWHTFTPWAPSDLHGNYYLSKVMGGYMARAGLVGGRWAMSSDL